MKKSIRERIKYYFKYNFMTGHISIGNLTLYGKNVKIGDLLEKIDG